ncbi:hypothetical protein SAMN02745945_01803 [Peptoclostridium litorale DSM 5388]|uniref:Uncharacterized protein n=1 Tax=Peptoclostridium litorale DSM 5388 TaxID=1121324 RepID=A0A069RGI6_PEPLI|nr:hypothetical protein [Peptoclostridium litorale]KDR95923.1 hypothetical protein CLIT_8c00920 [Peptoclostridium litorale DSM 5388]SIO09890.1 hypothetical protein SAMN02745945_01803 [Peptoclostridium litorale DSM 5388]
MLYKDTLIPLDRNTRKVLKVLIEETPHDKRFHFFENAEQIQPKIKDLNLNEVEKYLGLLYRGELIHGTYVEVYKLTKFTLTLEGENYFKLERSLWFQNAIYSVATGVGIGVTVGFILSLLAA